MTDHPPCKHTGTDKSLATNEDFSGRSLLFTALGDHLVVAGEHRHASLVPYSVLSQERDSSKCANRQGAKSARSLSEPLLALLALITLGFLRYARDHILN
jgi:hypothetical protein